ncbi:5764_t:CDS:2 [Cetraspora pellucida]|uniref:5764_t:CDS:1 n=1 Tax=Cetraspora pellucida TaxID=1433469 RepID=A0ACA9NMV3_9GLOM|nr:5764_t:CDS:2 [Cetraspora pellucida]
MIDKSHNRRLANNKISAATKPAKWGRKKKIDILNDNSLQNKTNTVSKRGRKKKQEAVASSSSQMVDELLNSDDDIQDNNEAANTGGLPQSSNTIPSWQLSPELGLGIISPNLGSENMSPALESEISSQVTAPSRQSSPTLKSRVALPRRSPSVLGTRSNNLPPRQSSSVLGTRSNNLNDFVSSYQLPTNPVVTPLRTSSIPELNFSNSSLGLTSNSIPIPSIFSDMTIYQISTNGSPFMHSISSTLSTTIQNQNDKAKAGRDFLEELKCLFLRVEWLHIAKRHFGDFRNKLINGIEELVENFKEQRNRPTTSPLQKEEIITFVDESATIHVLSRWLNATNTDELHAQNSISHLCKFIQSAFAINYTSRDIEGTKALDRLTKNIAVPSLNGKNFASNLKS